MSKHLFSILIIGHLLISCSKQPQKNISSEIIFTYEKTPCMGACPVFTFSLYDNGRATYYGKRNVEFIGNFEKELSDQEVRSFMELLNASNLTQYEDNYTGRATDLPTTKMFYANNENPKHIVDYYGAPQSLKETEKKIEALINAIEWK